MIGKPLSAEPLDVDDLRQAIKLYYEWRGTDGLSVGEPGLLTRQLAPTMTGRNLVFRPA